MSEPDVHTQIAGYAMDALEPDERQRVEEHLAQCAQCRDDLREFRETTARLADAEAVDPPEELWQRLQRTLPGVSQLPPRGSLRRVRHWHNHRLAWAAAASLLVVALVLGGMVVRQEVRMAEMDEHGQKVDALLASPDAVMAEGEVAGSSAEATVVTSQESDMALVVIKGLPPAPEGMGYQLWYVDADHRARPATMLRPDEDAEMLSGMSSDYDADAHLGISMEPAEGTSEPSEEPMMIEMADGGEG